MNKKLFKYEITGFAVASLLGTLNHFLFDLLGKSVIAGLFFPVNESIWEHQKLLFFPYILWAAVEYFLVGKSKSFFFSKLTGITAGIVFTIAFFYTYTGISGKESTFFDILSFFLGMGLAFAVSYTLIKNAKGESILPNGISIIILVFIAAVFFLFTIAPPLIPLFKDPITSTYGI